MDWIMAFNATFNNISVTYFVAVSFICGFELTTSVVIGTDCMGRCKSNYHAITATKAPPFN